MIHWGCKKNAGENRLDCDFCDSDDRDEDFTKRTILFLNRNNEVSISPKSLFRPLQQKFYSSGNLLQKTTEALFNPTYKLLKHIRRPLNLHLNIPPMYF